jgi:hypothetical protein
MLPPGEKERGDISFFWTESGKNGDSAIALLPWFRFPLLLYF